MKTFRIKVPVDCTVGHLRYGHLEFEVEAETVEEAITIAKDSDDYDIIVDDYEIDFYDGEKWEYAHVEELEG